MEAETEQGGKGGFKWVEKDWSPKVRLEEG